MSASVTYERITYRFRVRFHWGGGSTGGAVPLMACALSCPDDAQDFDALLNQSDSTGIDSGHFLLHLATSISLS